MRFRPLLTSPLVLAGALAIATPALADDYADGVAALQAHHYAAAIAALTRAADAGNARAQFYLALMYQDGDGVPQDKAKAETGFQKAIALLEKAAGQNDVEAMIFLGSIYEYGIGTPTDEARAGMWLKKAADQGNADAQAMLGMTYIQKAIKGRDLEPNAWQIGRMWLEKAASQGNAGAQYGLGMAYVMKAMDNTGGAGDLQVAEMWLEKAANQGNAQAAHMLAGIYGNGPDQAKAALWAQKAADLGDTESLHNLAFQYRHGQGVPKDAAKAIALYEKAGEQGDSDALCELGDMYRDGEGVPQDDAKAVTWYQKAADEGSRERAYAALDALYAQGRYTPPPSGTAKPAAPVVVGDAADGVAAFEKGRYVSALAPLTRAADAGNADAQYRLGLIYKDGLGVPTDEAKASVLFQKALPQFQKAADAGDADALYVLGRIYGEDPGTASGLQGKSVDELQEKSAELFRKAAYQGDAHAQYMLSILSRDSGQSAFWLKKAAEQGDIQAMAALEPKPVSAGDDAKADPEALALLQKAAEAGDANAWTRLGDFYLRRAGTDDGTKAVALFEKAMEQGHTDIPYYRIGWAYQYGEGMPKDGAKAALWYQRSIEREDVADALVAADHLSDIYTKGDGVPRDPAKARYWERKAESRMKSQ